MKTYMVVQSEGETFVIGVVGRSRNPKGIPVGIVSSGDEERDLDGDLNAMQSPVHIQATGNEAEFRRMALTRDEVADRFPEALAAWDADDDSSRMRAKRREALNTIREGARDRLAKDYGSPVGMRERSLAAIALDEGSEEALIAYWQSVPAS